MTLTCCPFTPLLEFDGPEFFHRQTFDLNHLENANKVKRQVSGFSLSKIYCMNPSSKDGHSTSLKLKDNFFCPP